MISLAKKFDIIYSHFNEGKAIKAIAREQRISKNTVKSYIREYESQKQLILQGGDKSEILLSMNEEPVYNASNRIRTVFTDEVIDEIKACLAENERKKVTGKAKIQMKGTDIFEHLIDKGFKLSYSSVTNYVRKLSESKKEAYIKQHYEFGEVCEFDWGDVTLTILGKDVLFKMAVFTLASSNIRFSLLYRHENSQAFVDSHIRFFAFLGHVPHQMVYDNMRVAIAKFVGKNEKVPTLALKQMSTYYGFNFRFCNIRSGNEKGHVERSVEFVRRKAFCNISEFNSYTEATDNLVKTVNRINSDKMELLEKEKLAMLPKPPDYSSVIRTTAKVDKFSTIRYANNNYSLSDGFVHKDVEVFVFVNEIVIKHDGKIIGKHIRSYEQGEYILDIMHFKNTFSRKPGALKNSLCLRQSSDLLKIIYNSFFADQPKEFLKMLDLLDEFELSQIRMSIETLLDTGAKISVDCIKMLLQNKPQKAEVEPCDDIEKACEIQLLSYCPEVVA